MYSLEFTVHCGGPTRVRVMYLDCIKDTLKTFFCAGKKTFHRRRFGSLQRTATKVLQTLMRLIFSFKDDSF